MGFFISPKVQVNEKDYTSYVPVGPTSVTGVVGNFQWGPINTRTLVTTDKELIDLFGYPDDSTYEHWFTAWNFLQYAKSLYVVRGGADGKNSNFIVTHGGTVASLSTVGIDNYEALDTFVDTTYIGSTQSLMITARYPGTYGNNFKVTLIGSTTLTTATYFGTSTASISSLFDEKFDTYRNLGILVFRLKRNKVHSDSAADYDLVEKWVVSTFSTAKDAENNSIYIEDKVNRGSKYIYAFHRDNATIGTNFSVVSTLLSQGSVPTYSSAAKTDGYDLFKNPEEFDINMLIDGGNADSATQAHIIDNILLYRKDAFGILNIPKSNVVGQSSNSTIVDNCVNYMTQTLNKSNSYYGVYDNWKYQYDKWNDKYRWVPLSGDIAGLFAATDYNEAPWIIAAGFQRGKVKNYVKLAYTPNEEHRNVLQYNNVNNVLVFKGEGAIIFGMNTGLTEPSAFKDIDVRRLFLFLEKNIATAAKYQLFKKNIDFTRKLITSQFEAFLRRVQGADGIAESMVICDETNNTGDVIDRNELVCDIFIKPTRTAKYIILNFNAVGSSVKFEEITGA